MPSFIERFKKWRKRRKLFLAGIIPRERVREGLRMTGAKSKHQLRLQKYDNIRNSAGWPNTVVFKPDVDEE